MMGPISNPGGKILFGVFGLFGVLSAGMELIT
jgi:hypothetical protein